MTAPTFDRWVRTFCIGTVLYVYLFILSDILRLNPDDDGDIAGIGRIAGFFPMLAVVAYILLDGTNGRLQRLGLSLIQLSLLLMSGLFTILSIINLMDGSAQATGIFARLILLGSTPIIPLGIYLIYKKIKTDRVSVGMIIVGVCIIVLSIYPAKNYIQAKLSGDQCATVRLVVKQYAGGPASWHQQVRGDVVCIAVDRGYPSETYAWRTLDSVDSKTYEYLDEGYSRDKNAVYYEGIPIAADPATFQIDTEWPTDEMANFIRGGTAYKSDGQNIFFRGQRVPVADMRQFRLIDFCHSYRCATDGFSVFQEGKRVEGVNVETLTSFHSCEYTRDDKHVYFGGEMIMGADVHTFDISGGDQYCYAYDQAHMYYKGTVVPGARPNTLRQVSPGDPFSPDTDGENIYYDGKRLDLDISTFQYLGKSVSKDSISVYQGAEKIAGADAATFELVPATMPHVGNVCARDKFHRYFDGAVDDHPVCSR